MIAAPFGSVRVVTDAAGQEVRRHDFLPFGEEWPAPQTPPRDTHLFTGKERDPDAESGLDYFGARFYDRQVGRFTTIDPVYSWEENLVDPQRWNRYAYVRNNPLKYTDPTGMYLDGCGGVPTKACAQAVDKFEKERQKALNSKNADVREAASQYGDHGEANGVTVTPAFDSSLGSSNAATTQPAYPGGEIVVEFRPGLPNLRQTLVHEGVHVGQMKAFLRSFDPNSARHDQSLNLLQGMAEFQAFRTAGAVAPYFVGGEIGYFTNKDGAKIIRYLLTTRTYMGKFNEPLIGDVRWR